jgi:NADH:ubiquinone oxidoreductase subunit F (NADH-binding)
MSTPFKPLLSSRYGIEESWKLSNAERAGAYEVAKRALTTRKPAELKEEVKKANIRGRGGAGFPAGVKWGFLNKREGEEIYLVINADESEPGTFKDRSIMDLDPHRLIEGAIISCFAIHLRAGRARIFRQPARGGDRRGAAGRLSRRAPVRRRARDRRLRSLRCRRLHLR